MQNAKWYISHKNNKSNFTIPKYESAQQNKFYVSPYELSKMFILITLENNFLIRLKPEEFKILAAETCRALRF